MSHPPQLKEMRTADDWHLLICQFCDSRATQPRGTERVALMIADHIDALIRDRSPPESAAEVGTDVCPSCGKRMCRCTPDGAEIERLARPKFIDLWERVGIKGFWRQFRFWSGAHAPLNKDWQERNHTSAPSIDADGKTYHDMKQESHWQVYRAGWEESRSHQRELERCKQANLGDDVAERNEHTELDIALNSCSLESGI